MSKKHRPLRLLEGLPVVDGTKDIVFSVTKTDVSGAVKKNPAKCAAANAGRRELKTDVRVFLTRTYVKGKDRWERYITPESASREIVAFDRGSEFEPGEYVLKAPTATQRLGHHVGGVSIKTHAGKAKHAHHTTAMIREWKHRA